MELLLLRHIYRHLLVCTWLGYWQWDSDGFASEDQMVRQPQHGVDRGKESYNCQSRECSQSVQPSAVCTGDRRRAKQSCPPCESTAGAIAWLFRGATIHRGVGTSPQCFAERPARTCTTLVFWLAVLRHSATAHNNTTENILCSICKVCSVFRIIS